MASRSVHKLGLVGALLLVAGPALAPTAAHAGVPRRSHGDEAFHPDLGLRGGVYIELRVEVEKAVMDRASRRSEELEHYAGEKKVELTSITPDRRRPVIHVTVPEPARDAFKTVVMGWYRDMTASPTPAGFDLSFKPEVLDRIRAAAVGATATIIIGRVTKWGVADGRVIRLGTDGLLVELPGVTDLARAKALVGTRARLAFRIAEDQETGYLHDHFAMLKKAGGIPASVTLKSESGKGPGGTEVTSWYLESEDRAALEKARTAVQAYAPDDTMMAFEKEHDQGGPHGYRTFVLSRSAPVTGGDVADARVPLNPQSFMGPSVALTFDPRGSKAFGEMTAANVKRRLAIVLDGEVRAAPIIDEPIRGGRASISVGMPPTYEQALQEANDMALVLNAGALPAPVRILEAGKVGATLGGLSIEAVAKTVGIGVAVLLVLALGAVLVFRRRPSAGAPGSRTGA